MNTPAASFSDFSLTINENGHSYPAVRNISFSIEKGEMAALIGESGCGKTLSALSLIGLQSRHAQKSGSLMFDGTELCTDDPSVYQNIRGRRISMIFQEPMTALNPLIKAGRQILESVMLHQKLSREEGRKLVLEMMDRVGLSDVERVYDAYPHQLSGGQRQRVMIAMAFINDPELIIADEPTTALDVTIEAQIMDMMKRMSREKGTAVLLITHDLSLVRGLCSHVYIMYSGSIVESGRTDEVLTSPVHPYTRALLDAIPRKGRELVPIRGTVPALEERENDACPFAPRCRYAMDICREKMPKYYDYEGRPVLCHRRYEDICGSEQVSGPRVRRKVEDAPVLVSADNLVKTFPAGRKKLVAVNGISFEIHRGETLGLVGESGCGKSTTGNMLMHMLSPDSGTIRYDGRDISTFRGEDMKRFRRDVQMVFQDPYSSIDPYHRIGWLLEEPLRIHHREMDRKQRRAFVEKVLCDVGLDRSFVSSHPSSLSGGQRQRVAIALALMLNPAFVVLDEPVSALDVSVQAQILNLMDDLQDKYDLTYLFISHDLNVVSYMADRIAVMYLGNIVEIGPADKVSYHSGHPYTRALFSASAQDGGTVLEGEVPSRMDPPSGCPFHTRCPICRDICRKEAPGMRTLGNGWQCSCHFPVEDR